MKPNELREILLNAPRTKENRERIPESALVLWLLKSDLPETNEMNFWRIVRSTLIAASLVYIVIAERWNQMAIYSWFALVAYEYAYSRSTKVVANLASRQSEARYIDRVNEYLEKSYPGYRPPPNEISIFSVLPYRNDG